MAFLGKISRLPAELRNEVCRKLYDGVSSADILCELNAKPEVKKILTRYFNGEEISAQNLTAFKLILHFSENSKLYYLNDKIFEIDKNKIDFFKN